LTQLFQEYYRDQVNCDVELVDFSGEDAINAHQYVLVTYSPVFRKLLSSQHGSNMKTIVLDVQLSLLLLAVHMIYYGNVEVNLNQVEEFRQILGKLEVASLEDCDMIDLSDSSILTQSGKTRRPYLRSQYSKYRSPFSTIRLKRKLGTERPMPFIVSRKLAFDVAVVTQPEPTVMPDAEAFDPQRYCLVCKKNYSSKQSLAKHTRRKHQTSQHTCTKCTEMFYELRDLEDHYHKIHGLEEILTNRRKRIKRN
jgi:hypothetical protein